MKSLILLSLLFVNCTLSSLLKKDGLYIIDKKNNLDVVENVFLNDGVILIGISQSKYFYHPFKSIAENCDECALMEKELKKAAALIKHTKEKIEFGMITV